MEKLFHNMIFKIFLVSIISFYFLYPTKSHSKSSENENKNGWVEVIMISGLIIAVVKYVQNKVNSENHIILKRTEDDSSSFALKYVLSSDSLETFNNLSSEEERETFSENFWKNLDPYPFDKENELKTEFYERVKYANTNFTTPFQPGWRTDMGRIYILYGQPAEILRLPFQESIFEGSHSLQYVDLEVWYYNRSGGIQKIPEQLNSLCDGRMFFLFGNLPSSNSFEQLYSSEIGEINHTELFQKPIGRE